MPPDDHVRNFQADPASHESQPLVEYASSTLKDVDTDQGKNDAEVEEAKEEFCRQWTKSTRRIAVFVEPSPFSHVSGIQTRFLNFIRQLRDLGDEVLIVTTHKGAPKEYYGAEVVPSLSVPFPFYPSLPLSLALAPRIIAQVADFKPDVIHAISPGLMCFGALTIARCLNVPILMSYHTDIFKYIPLYTFEFVTHPSWSLVRFLHTSSDHTITTSKPFQEQLLEQGAAAGNGRRMGVWPKAVDSECFHPRFRSAEMRHKLLNGLSDRLVLLHVGRLGVEKKLPLLKPVLQQLPGICLAVVGDGPHRSELEDLFADTPTVFLGTLKGAELSAAYASADLFVTPSESETLGNVVLEAMASGVPVVAARAGGIPDIVDREGVNGFLFEPGSVEDAVAKIKPLVESTELRETTSSVARQQVEKMTWKESAKCVRDVHYATAVHAFHHR